MQLFKEQITASLLPCFFLLFDIKLSILHELVFIFECYLPVLQVILQ